MKKLVPLAILLCAGTTWMMSASLYNQSVAEIFRKRFNSPSVSYLLMDVPTARLLVARWQDPDRPVPIGSLVKPFTALAYAQSHGFVYPELTCHGSADGCWLARGHGRLGMTEAVGHSCNAYFRKLAELVSSEDIQQVALLYGLRPRLTSFSPPALVGLGADLEVSPAEITKAYIELASRGGEPGVTELLSGMALSARRGTAGAIQTSLPGASALAKTGTAPCVHSPRAPGDGYTIVLYPAGAPRWALLVRVHGVPGARAAQVAGEMLRTLVTGR
jgi:cell division protein FtsI/penicillin-binding protein 2